MKCSFTISSIVSVVLFINASPYRAFSKFQTCLAFQKQSCGIPFCKQKIAWSVQKLMWFIRNMITLYLNEKKYNQTIVF